MFHRIIHAGWTDIIPILSFGLLFLVFVVATVRALRLKPDERQRLAELPLQDHPPRRR